MTDKSLKKSWKKVYESDLIYITAEMEELLEVPAAICLTGTLGAGKTTLCKKLTKNEGLQSTSYSLVATSGK